MNESRSLSDAETSTIHAGLPPQLWSSPHSIERDTANTVDKEKRSPSSTIDFALPKTLETMLISGCLKLRRFSKDGLFGWEPKQCQLFQTGPCTGRFEFGDKVVPTEEIEEIQRKDSQGLRFDLRKADGEGLSFLAFTDEDCSNWTEHLGRLVGAANQKAAKLVERQGEENLPLNRSKESVDMEASQAEEANKRWGELYPTKGLELSRNGDVSELQTKSESFATKKIKTRKSRAVRAKTKAKTTKAKRSSRARDTARSADLRRTRIAASRSRLSEPRMIAQRSCECPGSPARPRSKSRISSRKPLNKSTVVGPKKSKIRQSMQKEIDGLNMTLAEERRVHAAEVKRLQSNFVKIQKLLQKESLRCEALQTELCELTEKHFQDQVVIASLKSQNQKQ